MTKLPWEFVSREMDKLYEKQFSPNDTAGIDAHIDHIKMFLHACGWTEDDYTRALFEMEPVEELPN